MDAKLIASIRERHQRVLEQIVVAGARSGNTAARLVVVTKSQPLDVVRAAILAGAAILGENYPEEAEQKISALGQTAVEWHMIGHVQSRKADLVVENFTMLHSLDSLKLAGRLDRLCAERDRFMTVLVEVNVSGEESKYGFPAWDEQHWSDLLPIFEQLGLHSRLRLRGLMSMPPYFEDQEQTRIYFRRIRQLRDYLITRLPRMDLPELSMGTSADFVAAVEEGATYVRVGQAILGPRPVYLEKE